VIKLKLLFFVLLFSVFSLAQTRDKTISYENPDGKKLSAQVLTDQALKQLAEELVVEFIGADSFAKNKTLVNSKIVNQANKFTPFQKVESIERGDFGARITVQFKVSLGDFRKLLSDAGLFAKTRLASDVISFLSLEDSGGDRLSASWSPDMKLDSRVSLITWTDEFKKSFDQAGYFFNRNLNPAWISSFKKSATIQDVLSRNTNQDSLVLWGTARLTKNGKSGEPMVTAQIKVYSQKLKKEVTDSVRRWRLQDLNHRSWATWAQELILQIDEVDTRSLTEGSSLVITMKGSLSLTQQDAVKSWILGVSPLIKSATERNISQDLMSFEVDTTSSVDALAQRIAGLDFRGSKLKVLKNSNLIEVEILQ
jgi:hypothetical protein